MLDKSFFAFASSRSLMNVHLSHNLVGLREAYRKDELCSTGNECTRRNLRGESVSTEHQNILSRCRRRLGFEYKRNVAGHSHERMKSTQNLILFLLVCLFGCMFSQLKNFQPFWNDMAVNICTEVYKDILSIKSLYTSSKVLSSSNYSSNENFKR